LQGAQAPEADLKRCTQHAPFKYVTTIKVIA
jgi:hypothetical protein